MANLVNGLGGVAGFGENTLARGDDNSSVAITVGGLFALFPSGLELFGAVRNQLFINNNGNITFGGSNFNSVGPTNLAIFSGVGPVIAPYWADVDTSVVPIGGVTPGGTSTGSSSVYWDFDFVGQTFTVTWDDVARFSADNSVRNAFQLRLIKATDPLAQADDFQIEFRYENINWATNSGGSGTAVAGIGDGTGATAITLPQSGNNGLMLDLENQTNVGDIGRFVFTVRNGVVQVPGAGNQVLAGTFANERLDAQGGNDTLFGLAGDDTLVGAQGNDSIDGGIGTDVVDYSGLGGAVTLRSQGVILKGALGSDTIAGIETIIGAAGFRNVIDGQVTEPPAQVTRFNIDLSGNSLKIENVPSLGNIAFTVQNFVDVRGTVNDDTVIGSAADNIFFGSRGNDRYDGLGGTDTVDYSGLGGPVSLRSQGVIGKGALGTDTIAGVERIIGAAGLANLIDGEVPGVQTTSFVVDLNANALTVKGIPVLGSVSFTVVNFRDVRGTDNADLIRGSAAANTFFGSEGDDTYNGLGGTDTVDYSGLGGAVTLLAQGVISKGALGTDTIANMEKIIGAAGFANFIDAQIAGPQTTSLITDLSFGFLIITGIPFLGSASFTVENFVNVRGGANNDVVIGSALDNTFFGTRGDDFYNGADGTDTLDYSGLGGAVTLLSQGVIDKGAFGTDQIFGIETIIGEIGRANLIDGTVAAPQATNFLIDLVDDLLVVENIPGIGSATFTVVNFRDVRGTANADKVNGQNLDNTFFGSAGNDKYDGRTGFDTIDYTGLGGAIVLKSQGVIEKGALGTDTIEGMERIVGAAGFANRIDGLVAGPQSTSFDIDLQANSLVVNGVPVIGSIAFVVENFTEVRGTANNDIIRGAANPGVETFFGSTGSDFYDGRGGFDQISYQGSGIGPITLQATGIVDKGAAGIDTLVAFERISAEVATIDLIDAFTAGPQPTRVFVDLDDSGPGVGILRVFDIPFASANPLSFIVDNFENVRGTTNDDTVFGGGGDNTFFGTTGNDSYDGRAGTDTIDYSGLGGAVTLLAQGVINKGPLGTDSIANMERIVGAVGFANTIDGTIATPATQTTSFVVDLGANALTVNGIPAIGSASFTVLNFVNVTGTNNADTITGNAAANVLNGAGGNDLLNGGEGNDLLNGGEGDDQLIGGVGGDALNGGNGLDFANYLTATSNITVNLGNVALNTGVAAGDSYVSIERIQGTNFNDRLIGFNLADDLRGEGGNDVLNGGDGNDTLGGGAGDDSLLGGNGNDSLIGAVGNDTLNGGAGNDILTGSPGSDTLIGGTGFDLFVYVARGEGADTITDFNVAQDNFQLNNSGFVNVFPLGVLPAARFAANLTGTATAATAQILYDTDGGQLYFDIDGTGGAARQLLATLTNLAPLTAADFVIVA